MPTTDELYDLLQAVNGITLQRIEDKIDEEKSDLGDVHELLTAVNGITLQRIEEKIDALRLTLGRIEEKIDAFRR